MRRMFVGGLAPDTKEEDVQELFSKFGTVRSIHIASDPFTGTCRGFGFVEMEGHEARAAMAELDGKSYKGKYLRVNEENPRAKRGGGRRRRR